METPIAERPALAIARFKRTVAQAAMAFGLPPEEKAFLADLRALLEYVDALEAVAPTIASGVVTVADLADEARKRKAAAKRDRKAIYRPDPPARA